MGSVLDRGCGVHRQSIDQLAYVQEATNGMEPSRSAVFALCENGGDQRATGTLNLLIDHLAGPIE